MNQKKILRVISLIMLIVAIGYILAALGNPAFGPDVRYLGNFRMDAHFYRICHLVYLIIMVVLYVLSCFVKDKKD